MSGHFRLSLLASAIVLAFPAWAADKNDNSSSTDRTDTLTVVGNWLDSPDYSTVVLDHPGARTIVTEQQVKEKAARRFQKRCAVFPGFRFRRITAPAGAMCH